MPISCDTFIATVFDGLEANEHVLLARQVVKGNGQDTFSHAPWGSKLVSQWERSRKPGGIYHNVATVKAPEEGEPWRRRKQDCIAAYVVVLDDIGTKVLEHPPVEPSYKIETSKGNYQWGYLIQPYEDLERYASIVEALAELGFTDKGAGGYNRVMRIPGSINIKPGRGNFVSTVTEWEPKRIFELDNLATELGVDLKTLGTAKRVTPSKSNDDLADIDVIDPLYTWLRDNGHVIDDDGEEWVTIRCPWSDKHTTGNDSANYSPLGRGDGDWGETRGFKCFHEHCLERHFPDFRDWAVGLGAPYCEGLDPLPWLQDRYVVVGSGKKIADMHQRPHGGVWIYDLEEWSICHYRMLRVPGRDNPVLLKTAFLEHRNTRILDAFAYVPCADETTKLFNQPVVNTYVEPTHPETDEVPEIFLEHIEYLVGGEGGHGKDKDLFLDWLAYKIQHPEKRSFAMIMVAQDAFGTGRSWIARMLRKVLQGKVNTASLGQLIGKGTSGENNFNDWAAECQFLVIEEAKDNLSADDFYKGYETFKQRVDTNTVPFRCNPKYGKTRDDFMYFNCLVFTNHSDAMILPENDRRICVLENPPERQDFKYYDRLIAALETDEPQKVYWYLKHRDISHFNHVYPPKTEAKMKMIEQSKSSVDEVEELALESLKGDIITKKALGKAVQNAAHDLQYGKIESDSGLVTGRLWKRIGKLRLGGNHGARYTIDNKQVEVRAIRSVKKWKEVDHKRDEDAINAELKLNMPGLDLSDVFS